MVDWAGAQRGVIGSALRDAACVPLILAEMRPEDFDGTLRRYYEAFVKLSAESEPVDRITVCSLLGPEYAELTLELERLTPTAANVSAYIAICKDQSRLALLKQCGAEMAGAAALKDARAALDKAAGVSLDAGKRSSWSAAECVSEWFEALNRSEKPAYLQVGIDCLDNTLRTVAGDYVIVAGYTSHGKSAMALQMAWSLSREKRVGYFAFEGTRTQWTNRLIAYVSKVPLRKVQDKDLTPEEVRQCSDACSEIYQRPLYFELSAGCTVDDIRARTLQQRYDVDFVDYLQKVRSADAAKRFGRVQEVSEVSSGLQTMGLRYGVTVYAMSQLSRAEKSGEEYVPLPGLQDLRESGQIEQDADSVLFVHAPWKRSYPEFRMLDVAKVRNGTLKTFYADFLGDTQTFTEPTMEHASNYRRLIEEKRRKPSSGAGYIPGGKNGGFSKLTGVDPRDNPWAQEALEL